jgi:hypothetical protein
VILNSNGTDSNGTERRSQGLSTLEEYTVLLIISVSPHLITQLSMIKRRFICLPTDISES